jgi:hypothetical protein
MTGDLTSKIKMSKEFVDALRASKPGTVSTSAADIESVIVEIMRSQQELRKLLKPVDQLPGKLQKLVRIFPHRERLLFLKLFNVWRSRFSKNIRQLNDSLSKQSAQLDALLGKKGPF